MGYELWRPLIAASKISTAPCVPRPMYTMYAINVCMYSRCSSHLWRYGAGDDARLLFKAFDGTAASLDQLA